MKTNEKEMSVQPAWCRLLPIQQQSVLLLAARGPDGIAKNHPCKNVVRAYRGTVLVAAKYGRSLQWGEKADSFMSLDRIENEEHWEEDMLIFLHHVDELPHHYYLHLAHGAEILGYKHPDARMRDRWLIFYFAICRDMHLTAETEAEMDQRLGDWDREHWGDDPAE
jgi:hypothetical protein